MSLAVAWVTVARADVIVDARFETGAESFEYGDDAFRGTRAPDYEAGAWRAVDPGPEGALAVVVGNRDAQRVDGMSGGWTRRFRTSRPVAALRVMIRYRLTQRPGFEPDEFARIMATLDGRPLAHHAPFDYIDQIAGDGDGGPERTTGWRVFAQTVPDLTPGEHRLTVGLYANKKTAEDESVELLIGDVRIEEVEVAR